MSKPLVSISIPVLNEALNISPLIVKLQQVVEQIRNYEFEFVFTDNNSTDDTWRILLSESKKDSRIRNFQKISDFNNQYYSIIHKHVEKQ